MKSIVIDGNHLCHRVWNTAAGQALSTTHGTHTGVIHGFLASLCGVLKLFKSTKVTVVWDRRSDYRNDLINTYKTTLRTEEEMTQTPDMYKGSRYANRTEQDHTTFHDVLLPQMQALQYILPKLGIRQLMIAGVEGDDLIGLAIHRLRDKEGEFSEIIIVSSDHDLWQLLDANVRMYDPIKKKVFTANDFVALLGCAPWQLPEIRALSGDDGDDIPGVPRVGEKTAAKWIKEYGGLVALMEQAESAPKTALMSSIPAYKNQIQLALDLSYILNSFEHFTPTQCASFEEQWDYNPQPQWGDVKEFCDIHELKKAWSLIQDIFDTNELRDVKTFDDLQQVWGNCQRCELHKTRTNIVWYGGVQRADIMLIGEGPGASEDLLGSPFVGKSGRLLNKEFLEPNNIAYDMVHITNVVMCRPVAGDANRAPSKEEIAACQPRLFAQIRLVQPKVIVLIGDKGLKLFFPDSGKISRERGLVYDHAQWPGIKFVPVFHPSYLMRLPKSHSDAVKSRTDWALIGRLVNPC